MWDLLADFSKLRHQLCQRARESSVLKRSAHQQNAYGEESARIDQLLERTVVDYLREQPDIQAVYSEESGYSEFRQKGYVVVLDPLDGTHNYRMGLSYYATSMALLNERHEVVCGLVINLASGTVFSSARGKGARRNGRPIRVRQQMHPSGVDAIFVGLSRTPEELAALSGLAQSLRSFRAMGCAALDLCCLASGNCGLFVDLSNTAKLVDVLAAALIVEEAGGTAVTLEGLPLTGIHLHYHDLAEAVYQARFRTLGAATPELHTFARHQTAGLEAWLDTQGGAEVVCSIG